MRVSPSHRHTHIPHACTHTCTHTSLRRSTHTLVGTSAHFHPHTRTWVFPCLSWAQMDPHSYTHRSPFSAWGSAFLHGASPVRAQKWESRWNTCSHGGPRLTRATAPSAQREPCCRANMCVPKHTVPIWADPRCCTLAPSFTHARAHTHHPQSHGPSLHSGSTPYSPPPFSRASKRHRGCQSGTP